MAKWWGICANMLHLHRGKPCRWLPKGKGEFRVYMGHYTFLLHYHYGTGIWCRARCRRTQCPYREISALRWEEPNVKKRIAKGALEGDAKHLAPMESNRLADVMPLVEHCAIRKYDDGDPREPGWFTVKTQGSAWIVQVKDPDGGVSFSAVGQTIDQAFETAALLLACDEAPWEPDRFLAAQKAGGKKK